MQEIRAKRIKKFREFEAAHQDKSIWLYCGGKNSGKSHRVGQIMVQDLFEKDDMRSLVTRATGPALHDTAYQTIVDILQSWNLNPPMTRSPGNMRITNGRNQILFRPMDERSKFKSLNVNDVWIEEATELSWEEFTFLLLQARRPNKNRKNRIYLTCNTDHPYSWVRERIAEDSRDDVAVLYTTVYDNPFATERDIQVLENLKEQNIQLWRAYLKGEWAAPEGLIFSKYELTKDFPDTWDARIWGIDRGFNNPTAVTKICLVDGEPWIRGILYRTGMTTPQLIAWVKQHIPTNEQIWADLTPDQLQEFQQAGYYAIYPAPKAPGSRRRNALFCQRFTFHLCPDDYDYLKEIRSFAWKTDKDGKILEDPIDIFNHYMDATMYPLYGFFNQPRAGIL